MVHVNPETKWMKTIAPMLAKKHACELDAWGTYPSPEVQALIEPLAAWVDKVSPTAGDMYPTPWGAQRQLSRAILQTYVSKSLQQEFAEQFRGMSKEDLEECAKSFSFENCLKRDGLNTIMREHAKLSKA
jgi:hypothetical protein